MSNSSRVILRITGSLVAVIAGVLAGLVAMLLLGWDSWSTCLIMIGIFAVPVWALVLLPMHILLPRSSPFWDLSAAAGIGAAVGGSLVTIYLIFIGVGSLFWLFLPIGVLVGVVTGLVGAFFACLYEAQTA
jgi:hypothetical protein